MLKDKILALLMKNKNEIVTGGELARRLGVSRTAVWKAIGSLKEDGYEIESLKNSGYRFLNAGDVLSESLIRSSLTAKFFGNRIDILETTTSTIHYIKERATGSTTCPPEGYAVLADGQTGGRGRMGRSFSSPRGEGVYLSLLLKPAVPPEEIQFLTICAAVAVSNALQKVCGFEPSIKWVNDIYYDGKKICGILTEAVINAEMGSIESVVVGMGVNTGNLAADIKEIATSTYEITGKRGDRNAIAAEILNQFEGIYLDFTQRGKKQEILKAYANRQYVVGRCVIVSGPGLEPYEAVPTGLDEAGRLIVIKSDGTTQSLNSGEVSLKVGGTNA